MALTTSKLFHTVMGDKQVGAYKITGDASSTATWSAPVTQIDFAVYQEGTDTTPGDSSGDNFITWSGSTVTWAAAIASGTYGYLFYVGT